MSWVEKVDQDIVITTGDGIEYTPLWFEAKKSKEYNLTEYQYPGVPGSFVDRQLPQGPRFELTLVFEGAENLEQADRFWRSADNKRPWQISHPLYGAIQVQPESLSYDDSEFNVTRIKAPVIETTDEQGPEDTVDVTTNVQDRKAQTDQAAAEGYASEVQPDPEDGKQLQSAAEQLEKAAKGSVKDSSASEQLANAVRAASRAAETATVAPQQAIQAAQNLIGLPATFEDTVQNRLDILTNQYESLRAQIAGTTPPNQKKSFEVQQAANLGAQAVTAVTPIENYVTRGQILSVRSQIAANYEQFIQDLDQLQTDTAGTPEAFVPDNRVQRLLATNVNSVLANLYRKAFRLKREKTYRVPSDTNIFVLAHALYGLDAEDKNLKALIDQNGLGLEEYFLIPQGRLIRYYA